MPSTEELKAERRRREAQANELPPSQCDELIWVTVLDVMHAHAEPRAPGKWVIERFATEIDALWATIAGAVRAGRLWQSAKASTRLGAKFHAMRQTATATTHSVCVYTHDAENQNDVSRIRRELAALGITEELGYRPDTYTHRGLEGWRYRAGSDGQLTVYPEPKLDAQTALLVAALEAVPIHQDGHLAYAKFSDVPQAGGLRDALHHRMYGSTCPVVDGIDPYDALYAHDFESWRHSAIRKLWSRAVASSKAPEGKDKD